MRIAILHGSNDAYGATRVLVQEILCLVTAGHTVAVVVPHPGPLAHLIEQAGLTANVVVDPRLAVLRRSKVSDVLHPIRLPRTVLDADVVVLWTLALAAYIPLLRAKRKSFYVSVHELLLSRMGSLLVRVLLAPGHFPVCACSEATAMWLERNGVTRSRLTVMSPVFEPVTTVQLHEPRDSVTIAVVGRVNGHKGHLEVARAFQSLPVLSAPWRLLLFGAPFPGQEAALHSVLTLIAADSRIEYRGEADSVASIAGEIDAVACFPSTPEPFGLVPVEAWRVGVRAVGFADGGAGEVLPIVGGIGVARSGAPVDDIVSALTQLEQTIRARIPLPDPLTVNPKFSLERRSLLLTRVVELAAARKSRRPASAR